MYNPLSGGPSVRIQNPILPALLLLFSLPIHSLADYSTTAHPSHFQPPTPLLLPTDVINTGGSPVAHDTNPTADAALLNYIQSLYTNPNTIPGTTSLILRLNYDDPTYSPVFATLPNHYTIASADNASSKPTL